MTALRTLWLSPLLLLGACTHIDDPRDCDLRCIGQYERLQQANAQKRTEAEQALDELAQLNASLDAQRAEEARLREDEARLHNALQLQQQRLDAARAQLDVLQDQGRIDAQQRLRLDAELDRVMAQMAELRARQGSSAAELAESGELLGASIIKLDAQLRASGVVVIEQLPDL